MNDEGSYITYDEARTRKVAAEAEIAELELAKIRNDLAIVEDVVKAWRDVLAAMKAKLLAIPTKVGPSLASEDDASLIQLRLEDEIKECLDELATYDPLSDPTGASISVSQPEGSDGDIEATPKANSKRVGRPKKAARLTEK